MSSKLQALMFIHVHNVMPRTIVCLVKYHLNWGENMCEQHRSKLDSIKSYGKFSCSSCGKHLLVCAVKCIISNYEKSHRLQLRLYMNNKMELIWLFVHTQCTVRKSANFEGVHNPPLFSEYLMRRWMWWVIEARSAACLLRINSNKTD